MSIAVSAVIKPSRLLRVTLVIYASLNLAAALFLLAFSADSFAAQDAIAACCALAAAAAGHACARTGNMRLIDISGVGEMRVTVQQNTGEAGRKNTLSSLLPGSTVWPGLMLLLTQSAGAKTAPVVVLMDSVGAEQFRALAVAVRAIGGQAAQDGDFFEPHKIL